MVLDIEKVQSDIELWIANFVEVPHPALGGWPPCPYARAARIKKSYEIILGQDPWLDLRQRAREGLCGREVWIYVYDPSQWNHETMSNSIQLANRDFLIDHDMIALEDHPEDVENVNGVIMNQGQYALILVQSLSDLNTKARVMANKGFYDTWPENYLQGLFKHRKDPR